MNCLVTGAAGHVGCALVRELLMRGHSVTAYVRKTSDLRSLDGLDISCLYGDITDEAAVESAVACVDVVFHIAGIIDITSGHYKQLFDVNVNGTRLVADACLKHGKRLMYMSSVHAIPELPAGESMSEINEFSPDAINGNYGKTKAEATKYVCSLGEKGLDYTIVHPSGIIGPYEFRISSLGKMIISYMKGRLPSYIDGVYNFVDVHDVCSAAANAGFKEGISGECFLLTGHQVTVQQFMDMLHDITGVKPPLFKAPYILAVASAPVFEIYSKLTKTTPLFTPYAVRTLRSNGSFINEKARRLLDFETRPIYDTLKDTCDWFKENGYI